MDVRKVAQTLSVLERKLVPFLKDKASVGQLVEVSGMQEVEVMRALQWLGNKGVVVKEILTQPVTKRKLSLTEKGRKYAAERKLPERKVLEVAQRKRVSREDVEKAAGLMPEEVNAAIGILKKAGKMNMEKREKEIFLIVVDASKSEEEKAFDRLVKGEALEGVPEWALPVGNLKQRGLVEEKLVKERIVRLTDVGKALIRVKIEQNVVDQLTPELLKEAAWKGKTFRSFDITSPVPAWSRGKRHFVDQAIQYIKRIWLDLGFKEMQGNIVQTSFWNLDALFVPQDHPAREMQDTFFLGTKKQIAHGRLPKELAAKIKNVHEHGGDTGSQGWGGVWKEEIARSLLLRTHTTVLSAQTIAMLQKADLPAKFFSVGKVYRNEAMDWKHLFEFYHVEGIVVDPNANFRNLIGYLKEFYKKMGFTQVRIRPSYFPFTEPSCEIEVFHPVRKEWVELGGAGIFRPEVVKPLLGFDCPVIAWGQGMDRIIVEYYKIQDLRDLYKNDLKQLREAREWLR